MTKQPEGPIGDVALLLRKRPLLCAVIVLLLILPAAYLLFDRVQGASTLASENTALRSEILALRQGTEDQLAEIKRNADVRVAAAAQDRDAKVAEITQDRDAKVSQLAPFVAEADKKFEAAPAHERLQRLLESLQQAGETISVGFGKQLSPEGVARIKKKLDLSPKVPITVTAVAKDPDALALAQQIYALFEGAGFPMKEKAPSTMVPAVPTQGILLRGNESPQGAFLETWEQLSLELGTSIKLAIDERRADWVVVIGSK